MSFLQIFVFHHRLYQCMDRQDLEVQILYKSVVSCYSAVVVRV